MVNARPRPPRLTIVELRYIVNDAISIVRRDPIGEGIEIILLALRPDLVGERVRLEGVADKRQHAPPIDHKEPAED